MRLTLFRHTQYMSLMKGSITDKLWVYYNYHNCILIYPFKYHCNTVHLLLERMFLISYRDLSHLVPLSYHHAFIIIMLIRVILYVLVYAGYYGNAMEMYFLLSLNI